MPDPIVPRLVHTSVPDLISEFLKGRSPHTLTAYGRDLNDFSRFLAGFRQEAETKSAGTRDREATQSASLHTTLNKSRDE